MLRVYSALIDVKRNFKLTNAFECFRIFTLLYLKIDLKTSLPLQFYFAANIQTVFASGGYFLT